jgi:hypothetical protein
MSTKTTLALSVIAATAVAFVVGPALIQAASADPAPKTVETTRCDDPKFQDKPQFAESCPGESEDATGDPRDDEDVCVARNNGQAKNCEGEVIDIVNP